MSHPLKMSHPALAHPAFSCKWQHEKGLAAFWQQTIVFGNVFWQNMIFFDKRSFLAEFFGQKRSFLVANKSPHLPQNTLIQPLWSINHFWLVTISLCAIVYNFTQFNFNFNVLVFTISLCAVVYNFNVIAFTISLC